MKKGQPSEEQIEQWKQEYGRVFYAEADGKKAWYRKPTRKDLSYALTLQSQPLEMSETLLRSCYLGGDAELHEESEYLLGCGDLVDQMMAVKHVEVGEA